MSAKSSSPSLGEEGRSPPRLGRRDRLVRALAARPELEALAQDASRPCVGCAVGAIGGVGDENAEDDDIVPTWQVLTSRPAG